MTNRLLLLAALVMGGCEMEPNNDKWTDASSPVEELHIPLSNDDRWVSASRTDGCSDEYDGLSAYHTAGTNTGPWCTLRGFYDLADQPQGEGDE